MAVIRRKEKGPHEKWGGASFPPHNKWQITDVISFDIMTIDTNEIVAHWENPDYKNKKGENNE